MVTSSSVQQAKKELARRLKDIRIAAGLTATALAGAAYGYLSTATLRTPLLDQLKIQITEPGKAEPSRNRDSVVAAAGEIGRWLQEDQGLAVAEIHVLGDVLGTLFTKAPLPYRISLPAVAI